MLKYVLIGAFVSIISYSTHSSDSIDIDRNNERSKEKIEMDREVAKAKARIMRKKYLEEKMRKNE